MKELRFFLNTLWSLNWNLAKQTRSEDMSLAEPPKMQNRSQALPPPAMRTQNYEHTASLRGMPMNTLKNITQKYIKPAN